jgi:hypothetical protein
MKKLLLLSLLVSACGSIPSPGDVAFYESKVDNKKTLDMLPGWIYATEMKLSLLKTNDMPKESVILYVETKLQTIAEKDSLIINIDGNKQTFSSRDKLSEPIGDGYFRKSFVMKTDYVKKMVAGKSVWIRVLGNGSTYMEGEFSKEVPTTAVVGFKSFISQLDKVN